MDDTSSSPITSPNSNVSNQIDQEETHQSEEFQTRSPDAVLSMGKNDSEKNDVPFPIIPKSRFVDLGKGNHSFAGEVIFQKLVVKVELPDIMYQGTAISRPENSVFNLGTEVCVCSKSEPCCWNVCLFFGVVWNRSNWESSPMLLFDFQKKEMVQARLSSVVRNPDGRLNTDESVKFDIKNGIFATQCFLDKLTESGCSISQHFKMLKTKKLATTMTLCKKLPEKLLPEESPLKLKSATAVTPLPIKKLEKTMGEIHQMVQSLQKASGKEFKPKSDKVLAENAALKEEVKSQKRERTNSSRLS